MSTFNLSDWQGGTPNPGATFIASYNAARKETEARKSEEAKRTAAAEMRAKLDAGDYKGAQAIAVTFVSPDEALKYISEAPKRAAETREIDVKSDGVIAEQLAPFAYNALQITDPEARRDYVRQNRETLLAKGALPQVLDVIEANPMDPAVDATLKAYAEAGLNAKDRSAAQVAERNSRFQKMGAGDTVYDVDSGKPVYGTPNETQDFFNPGIDDPRTAGGVTVQPSAAPTSAPSGPMASGDGKSYKDPTYTALAASAEAKHGLPSGILDAIRLRGERSNADQVSPAGARSVYQFIPQTRQAMIAKYGVDPWAGPEQASEAAALLLKENYERTGSWDLAIRAYHGGFDRSRWGPQNRDYIARTGSFDGQPTRQGAPAGAQSQAAGQEPAQAQTPGGWVSKQRPEKPQSQWVQETQSDGSVIQRDTTTGKVSVVSKPPKPSGPQAKPNDISAARTKYRATFRVEQQIDDLATMADQVSIKGPIGSLVPDVIAKTVDPKSDQYDRGVAAILDTITALTRLPGVGSQSDYEARLKAAILPERSATREGRAQAVADLKKIVQDIRAEQAQYLQQFGGSGSTTQGGSTPQSAPTTKTVVRTGRDKNGRKVVQYSDGSVSYAD